MNVRLLPADSAACGYYRHDLPAKAACAQGVNATITRGAFTRAQVAELDRLEHQGHARTANRPQGVKEVVGDATPEDGGTRFTEWTDDVVVFQRPAMRSTVELIPILQARGIAVVVDVDDDFSCLHPQHPTFDGFNPTLRPDHNYRHVQHACALADLVTVTTPALAERYGAHGRVAVLPNCIPESLLKVREPRDGETLGWGGAWDFHPGDLEVVGVGVREALERSGWKMRVVGPPGAERQLHLDSLECTGWIKEMGEYHRQLARLDVGIAPLGDSVFNHGKSSLKGIEYGALGVPYAASQSPAYRELAQEGLGVLTRSRGRNWRSSLLALMGDEALRGELADIGRRVVAEGHTIEKQGWRWCEAWERAYQLSGRRMAVLS